MTDHKATPEQWEADRYDWSKANTEAMDGDPAFRCLLELRARLEALEAANYARRIDIIRLANAVANQVFDRSKFFADVTPDDDDCQLNEEAQIVDYYAALAAQHQGGAVFHENSKPTPNDRQIRNSLVNQVAIAISRCEDSAAWDEEADNWKPEAIAAIHVIAGELRAQCLILAADWLEQEAKHD